MSGLGPDAIGPILFDALAAAMDRDADRLAVSTKPLFLEGDQADQYSFLSGLLEVVNQLVSLPRAKTDLVAPHFAADASQDWVDYGRLLAAHMNDDAPMVLALWQDVTRDDLRAASVLTHAIVEAGRVLRWKKSQS